LPDELLNLIALQDMDLCGNNLFTDNPQLQEFLDGIQPGWRGCQGLSAGRAMPWLPLLLLE
jgi:hypothetical protein